MIAEEKVDFIGFCMLNVLLEGISDPYRLLFVVTHVKLCRSRRQRVKLTPDEGAHWAGRAT